MKELVALSGKGGTRRTRIVASFAALVQNEMLAACYFVAIACKFSLAGKTEPTLSGMHDLDRIIELCRHFGIFALVCINKYDINEGNSRQIESWCMNQKVQVISRIPFGNVVTEALVNGLLVVEFSDGRVKQEIYNLWRKVSERLMP